GHYSQVVALSNSATFDQRSNLMQKVADAMDEAIEQDSAIVFPNSNGKIIQRAHQELSRKFGYGSILTIPMVSGEQVIGAMCLLRNEETPFTEQTSHLCQQAFSLLAPYLQLKQEQEQSLIIKIGRSLKQQLQAWFGLQHLKLKLAGLTLVLMIALSSLLQGDFRVSADAILEGRIQRVVNAPLSGYLLSASVRAGDTVKQGDVMASLNDSEIQLQLAKLSGELQKARREYREAQSTRNLVKVRVIDEQIKEIQAELELAQQQLDRINLTAPFDGVVIEGDLEQLLGAPVERGDTLFKIAPLEDYRIILKVDESQISHIEVGQDGSLILPSLAERTFPLTVEKITAASVAGDGANIFRVEASLNEQTDQLRPGMQGVGKIQAGSASLFWIWTHAITNRLRLWLWSWLP
nr:efflux RND transporter periplasmic adaptor subunit [Gammaproteobacteria bacterium]